MFSAALYAVFFAFFGFEKKLLLHGSALWIYYIVGALLAAIGLVLGVAGRGWVRNASILISLVMLFQWYGMMIIGSSQRAEGIVTIAMFIAVAVWGILLVGSRYFHALHFRKHA